MQDIHPQHTFSQEQKTGFVLLLIFGVLAVALGFLQIRNTIYTPFIIKATEGHAIKEKLSGLLDETTRLQTIDTDQDGLSDYDEINFIGTSAYLPDTDSDGIGDKQELDAGTDPLCVESKGCINVGILPEAPRESVGSELINEVPTASDIFSGQGVGVLGTDTGEVPSFQSLQNIEALIQNPEKLRASIVSTGEISMEELAQFSDEELVKTFQTVLTKQTDLTNLTAQKDDIEGQGTVAEKNGE